MSNEAKPIKATDKSATESRGSSPETWHASHRISELQAAIAKQETVNKRCNETLDTLKADLAVWERELSRCLRAEAANSVKEPKAEKGIGDFAETLRRLLNDYEDAAFACGKNNDLSVSDHNGEWRRLFNAAANARTAVLRHLAELTAPAVSDAGEQVDTVRLMKGNSDSHWLVVTGDYAGEGEPDLHVEITGPKAIAEKIHDFVCSLGKPDAEPVGYALEINHREHGKYMYNQTFWAMRDSIVSQAGAICARIGGVNYYRVIPLYRRPAPAKDPNAYWRIMREVSRCVRSIQKYGSCNYTALNKVLDAEVGPPGEMTEEFEIFPEPQDPRKILEFAEGMAAFTHGSDGFNKYRAELCKLIGLPVDTEIDSMKLTPMPKEGEAHASAD